MTRSTLFHACFLSIALSMLASRTAAAQSDPDTALDPAADTAVSKSSSSLGDAPGRHIDAGVFLGGNFFSNGIELGNAYLDDQVPTSGFLLGVRGTYVLIPHLVPGISLDPSLSVELEAKLAVSSTAGSVNAMRDSYSSPVLGWRAHAVASIWNDRPLGLFAVLGLGGETAFSSSPFARSVDTDAELHWGLGARYRIAPSYGVRGDFRHGITAGRFSLAANTVEVHVGFYYTFGLGGSQSLASPVSDSEPEKPEPGPTVVTTEPIGKSDPATIADADNDGIADHVDACPHRPENVNQIEDEDGCPEDDLDNDEILDADDKCPDAAEDADGFEDQDGCPDPDNDVDGRSDAIDACPQEQENLNGFEDEDGCPDVIPEDVQAALRSIRFRPRGVQLSGVKKQLLALETMLKAHPSIRLVISGHTDNREKHAKELSEKRASAVKAYLVGKGIEDTRLATEGHGADKPVASNRTRTGKARNRRVDFELIPGPAQIQDPTTDPAPDAKGSDPGAGATPDAKGATPDAKGATPDAKGSDPAAGATPDAKGATPDATAPAPSKGDAGASENSGAPK